MEIVDIFVSTKEEKSNYFYDKEVVQIENEDEINWNGKEGL